MWLKVPPQFQKSFSSCKTPCRGSLPPAPHQLHFQLLLHVFTEPKSQAEVCRGSELRGFSMVLSSLDLTVFSDVAGRIFVGKQ